MSDSLSHRYLLCILGGESETVDFMCGPIANPFGITKSRSSFALVILHFAVALEYNK